MARKITKRQQQIYDFIKEYQQEKGYPPSVREMASAVGLSSPSTVHAHLSALEARGLLKRDATKPRALELFNEDGSSVSISKSDEPTAPRGTVSLPLVGRVAAGIPILAEQNIEDTFTIPTEIATDQGSFILEVHGSSMINVGIFNGDYIIVREQKSAMNGEIVVAMIDGSATVKTFYKEQGRVRLQPENDTMEPIYATNPVILGKSRRLDAPVLVMQKRITIFDTVRGFTMISMAGFHACYDLAYLYGWDMPWFTQSAFQDIWRAASAGYFLFIAGWMCTLSRNNIKRAAKYALAALVVWLATTLVSVDDSVNFGIIYCMAACTGIVALTDPVLKKITARWACPYALCCS